jgi:hypothetical protein
MGLVPDPLETCSLLNMRDMEVEGVDKRKAMDVRESKLSVFPATKLEADLARHSLDLDLEA